MGAGFSNSPLHTELKKTKDLWHLRCAPEQQGPSLEENIEAIHRELQKIQKEEGQKKNETKNEAGIFMVQSGSFDVIAQKALEDLRPKGQSDIGGDGKEPHALLSIALATDSSDDVCDAVLQYPELYAALLFKTREILKSLRQESECPSALLGCVDILHNISLYLEDMEERDSLVDREHPTWYLRKANTFTGKMREDTTDILKRCIHTSIQKANGKEIRLKAMSALACLVTRGEGPGQDEDQGELIDPTFLAELISHFSIVLHETSNLSEQCSALAIERGLRHLLRSNDEKTRPKLTTCVVVDLLISGLNRAKIDEEETACFSSLWMLHFDSKCFKMMAESASLVALLKKKKAVKGTRRAESMIKALQDPEKPKETTLSKKHVMFSYQHSNQELVKKICEYLKSKDIKTWIDIDQMKKKRNIYHAMGEAVEEAEVFIMCMSKTYNHSENCEREATYACEKRKPILVLRLERDCEPNGWLGIIATGRLYIDFSKLENYDKNCDELLERIQEIKGGGTTENREQNNDNAGVGSNVEGTGQLEKDQGQVVSPRPNPAGNGKARRQNSRQPKPPQEDCLMATEQCLKFLLEQYGMKSEDLDTMSKKDLLYLVRFKDKAPEAYHRRMGRGLMMKTAHEVSRLTEVMNGCPMSSGSMTIVHCTF